MRPSTPYCICIAHECHFFADSESPRIPAYDNALFVQDGGVDKTQEALQYSASEIHEILAALDYAEV